MIKIKLLSVIFLTVIISMTGCDQRDEVAPQDKPQELLAQENSRDVSARKGGEKGVFTANGWYEAEEIYYILHGEEEGVSERGENDLYLIGGDRKYQANVAEFIPGEAGYSPHWNVNVVHTAEGVTLADILASEFASEHYPEALFDDAEDILDAEANGLVTIDKPGKVVSCPIISEEGAEAPGNEELSEDFPPFDDTF
jgi:hypothetical protein